MNPSIVIHGGAWVIAEDEIEAHKREMTRALKIASDILSAGGPAIDAVEKSICSMEDSGVFDAGRGSVLNKEGEVEMDAQIMCGDLKAGAVAALRNYPNPISVARKVMEKTPHMLLAGKGAYLFAEQNGFRQLPMDSFISKKEKTIFATKKDPGFGTVGCVALDKQGNLASGTSTGGTRNKMFGRVGDSPLIGCGGYCDSETGGASATGHGESFMKILACKTACDYLKTEKTAQDAANKTLHLLEKRTNGKGGIILLRKDGDIGIAFNTPQMARGYALGEKISVFL
ncbi:MAG: isoaspartyl peptidase/L-asparaginase [Candidatus Micrarchaeota archaeon]